MEPLMAAGAPAAADLPAAAGAKAERFCVSDGEAVERATFGADATAAKASKDVLFKDYSTTEGARDHHRPGR
jgi:3-hydroxyisobutyrate dehydrogenase-like beta-hydroxyacid dehydrogenase